MTELILTIISQSLKFIDQAQQDAIKNKIIQLRADYATELGKAFNDIDDAKLYSLELELRDICDLYCAGIQSTNAQVKS